MKITDKDRLNWLADPNHKPFEFTPQMSGGVFVWGHYGGGDAYYISLRKAIDAQIRAEKKSRPAQRGEENRG